MAVSEPHEIFLVGWYGSTLNITPMVRCGCIYRTGRIDLYNVTGRNTEGHESAVSTHYQ